MSYIITADSAANLTNEFIKENNIAVINLSLHTETGEPFSDFCEADGYKSFYNKLRQGLLFKTAQINPQSYIDFFMPFLSASQDILYISMSSGISGSLASANIAANELTEKFPARKIVIVDSLGASLGIYEIILRAIELQNNNYDIDTAAENLKALVPRIMQIFTVGDLMHLRHSGRISTPAAVFGTALGIKPILKGNEDGKIVICGKTRGRKGVLTALAKKYSDLYFKESTLPVCISHCDSESDASTLENMLRDINPAANVLTLAHEPTTAVHLGPDALALYFEGEGDVRTK